MAGIAGDDTGVRGLRDAGAEAVGLLLVGEDERVRDRPPVIEQPLRGQPENAAFVRRFRAPGSRLPAPGSRLPAPGSRLPAPGSRLPAMPCDRIALGPCSSVRYPWWLAAMIRSNRVCSACAHGMTTIPRPASTSGSPAENGSVMLDVATTCTRRSASKAGKTSVSRFSVVTLWTTKRTVRANPTVRHSPAAMPIGTCTGGTFIGTA